MSDLLACPFCSSSAVTMITEERVPVFYCHDPLCLAVVRFAHKRLSDAKASWNRRERADVIGALHALRKGLNERAKVETEMWNLWKKGESATPEQLGDWARRLGIPEEFRTTAAR